MLVILEKLFQRKRVWKLALSVNDWSSKEIVTVIAKRGRRISDHTVEFDGIKITFAEPYIGPELE